MAELKVEHVAEGDTHYAMLTCGRRLVLRVPIPQQQIDEAGTVLDDMSEAEKLMLNMFGADVGRDWALSDAADTVIAMLLARAVGASLPTGEPT